MPHDITQLTIEQWHAEGRRLFGDDKMQWRFVCPRCGHVATREQYQAAGAPEGAVGFSCIGRWLKAIPRDAFADGPGPCNYAGGGLFPLNPVHVDDGETVHQVFDFDRSGDEADAPVP